MMQTTPPVLKASDRQAAGKIGGFVESRDEEIIVLLVKFTLKDCKPATKNTSTWAPFEPQLF